MQVTVGIDSAKFDLGAGLIDEVGRTIEARKFANRSEDWKELLDWAKGFGDIVRVGVEGRDSTEQASPSGSSGRDSMCVKFRLT